MMIAEDMGVQLSDDRRQHERLERSFTIQYRRLEDLSVPGVEDIEAEIVDIGGGGLCFLSDDPIEISTQLVLVLEFSGWLADMDEWVITRKSEDVGVLKVVGMVVRVAVNKAQPDKFEIGVRFTGRIR